MLGLSKCTTALLLVAIFAFASATESTNDEESGIRVKRQWGGYYGGYPQGGYGYYPNYYGGYGGYPYGGGYGGGYGPWRRHRYGGWRGPYWG
uniref:Uncharacterized protein n=1 Tax=Plectus sambesii TaxID=2011161 RepID=A0A914W6H9_9BILA